MTQDFISERLADGVEIHEIDFMQRRHVVDECSELGQPLRRERIGTGDGNVYVGVGPGCAFWPGAKPDDVDIGAQDSSGQISDLLRNLSRSSHEFLVEHVPSVAVLTTMSTKLAWNEGQFEVTRTGPHVFVLFKEFLNTLFDGQLKPEQAYVQSVEEAEREKPR